MPPPPPPSASYNLKLDDFSDSEEEENGNYYRQNTDDVMGRKNASTPRRNSAAVYRTDGYVVEDATIVSLTQLRQQYVDGKVSKEEFAAALRAHQASNNIAAIRSNNHDSDENNSIQRPNEVVEAFNVTALTDDSDDEGGDDDDDDDLSGKMDIDEQNTVDGEVSSPVRKKKKKKKKRQKKKKKANANSNGALTNNNSHENGKSDQNGSETLRSTINEANNNIDKDNTDISNVLEAISTQSTPTKSLSSSSSSKSISFGTVSVREYARTIATHVVPADGGYPLGLSAIIVTEHNNTMDESGHVISTTSSPMKEAGDVTTTTSSLSPLAAPTTSSSSSPSSGSGSKQQQHQHHHNKHHDYHGWKIDDFESRKQFELQQRYIQLIQDQRRRNFEKQWEKKHHSQLHSSKQQQHSYNTRKGGGGGGRQRSGSFSASPTKGGGGGGRQRSGSFSSGSGGGGHGGNTRRSSSGYCKMEMSEEEKQELEQLLAEPVLVPAGDLETRPYDYKKKLPSQMKGGSSDKRDDLTEEEELFHNHRGRNPLFGITKEDERRRVLLRDDHLMKLNEEVVASGSSPRRSPRKRPQQQQDDDDDSPNNHLDPVFTQHIQHDLETLRIERSDPSNLGCSCRKLHVFLPGESDKSHHKKKGSNRRMNERKVREELRKRGLLHKGNSDMSRDKMEQMLHSAIESEPCCWGIDCPCVRSGIGCQADICSCWHASHDVPHTPTKKKGTTTDSDPRKVGESDVEAIERKCGNENGMYVVDMKKIQEYRQQYIATQANVEM